MCITIGDVTVLLFCCFSWFIYKTCKQQAKTDTSGKKKPKAASTGKKKSGTSKQKKDEIVSVFLISLRFGAYEPITTFFSGFKFFVLKLETKHTCMELSNLVTLSNQIRFVSCKCLILCIWITDANYLWRTSSITLILLFLIASNSSWSHQ